MIFPPRYKHIVSNYISSKTCVEKSHKDLFRVFENRTRQTLQFVTDKNEEKSTEMYSFCGLNRTAKGVQIPYVPFIFSTTSRISCLMWRAVSWWKMVVRKFVYSFATAASAHSGHKDGRCICWPTVGRYFLFTPGQQVEDIVQVSSQTSQSPIGIVGKAPLQPNPATKNKALEFV